VNLRANSVRPYENQKPENALGVVGLMMNDMFATNRIVEEHIVLPPVYHSFT
jgi:hypothetical protein